MARRSQPYRVELTDRNPHALQVERWRSYVAAGLLVVIGERLARLRDNLVQARLVEGELHLFDVGPRVKTNAEVIDRMWPLAHAGAYVLSWGEFDQVQAIRRARGENLFRPPEEDKPGTRAEVAQYLASLRTRRIQQEFAIT